MLSLSFRWKREWRSFVIEYVDMGRFEDWKARIPNKSEQFNLLSSIIDSQLTRDSSTSLRMTGFASTVT